MTKLFMRVRSRNLDHSALAARSDSTCFRRAPRRRNAAHCLYLHRRGLRSVVADQRSRDIQKIQHRAGIHLHRRRPAVAASVDRRRRGNLLYRGGRHGRSESARLRRGACSARASILCRSSYGRLPASKNRANSKEPNSASAASAPRPISSPAICSKNGISKPDKEVAIFQTGSGPQVFAALKGGSVQSGVLSTGPETLNAEAAGYFRLADVSASGLVYPFGPFAARQAFLKSQPELVGRFMKAYVEGIHRFKTDKAAALAVLEKYTKQKTTPATEKDLRNLRDEIFQARSRGDAGGDSNDPRRNLRQPAVARGHFAATVRRVEIHSRTRQQRFRRFALQEPLRSGFVTARREYCNEYHQPSPCARTTPAGRRR